MFTGIVSHMGGIGYDPGLYLNFRLLQITPSGAKALTPVGKPEFGLTDNKTPLLFYTGEYDLHRKACESARKIFLSKEFPIVDIFIEKGIGHEYLPNCESYILNWFESLDH